MHSENDTAPRMVIADTVKASKVRLFGDELVFYWNHGEPTRHKLEDWTEFYEANHESGNRYKGLDDWVQRILKKEDKVRPADLLYEYASLEWGIKPFMDADGLEHIQKFKDGYYEVIPLNDDRIVSDLAILYKNKFGEIIPENSIRSVIRTLKGEARRGPAVRLYNRAGEHEGKILYDLHNQYNQAVQVNDEGWHIVQAPLMFRNQGPGREQVKPIKGEPGQLDRYVDLLKIPARHKNMIKVTTIAAFHPGIENPIVALSGESGAGKSQQLMLERSIVDPQPNEMPNLSRNADEKDLKLAMSKYYWYGFDNIKGVPDFFGDFINTVTGGTTAEIRELYTTANTRSIGIKCVVRMNGITMDLTQSDSLKRSMIVDRDVLEGDALTPEELLSDLDSFKPELLGEIFTILSKALALLKVKEKGQYQIPKDISSRLVSFYQLGGAVCDVLGIPDWAGIFRSYVKAQDEIAVNENPIGQAVRELMKDRKVWVGQPKDLYQTLKDIAGGRPGRSVWDSTVHEKVEVEATDYGLGINVDDKHAFPQNPNWMMRKYLKVIVGNLRDENIFVTEKMFYEIRDLKISKDRRAVDESGCDLSKMLKDDHLRVIMITTVKPFTIPSLESRVQT